MMTRRALTVEDDPVIAHEIVGELERCGFAVNWMVNGRDGLVQAMRNVYDVITLDRMLPAPDGLTILSTIRAASAQTPVLLLSALGTADERICELRGTRRLSDQAIRARRTRSSRRISALPSSRPSGRGRNILAAQLVEVLHTISQYEITQILTSPVSGLYSRAFYAGVSTLLGFTVLFLSSGYRLFTFLAQRTFDGALKNLASYAFLGLVGYALVCGALSERDPARIISLLHAGIPTNLI
jgi:CheY-like chemotaxis protein